MINVRLLDSDGSTLHEFESSQLVDDDATVVKYQDKIYVTDDIDFGDDEGKLDLLIMKEAKVVEVTR